LNCFENVIFQKSSKSLFSLCYIAYESLVFYIKPKFFHLVPIDKPVGVELICIQMQYNCVFFQIQLFQQEFHDPLSEHHCLIVGHLHGLILPGYSIKVHVEILYHTIECLYLQFVQFIVDIVHGFDPIVQPPAELFFVNSIFALGLIKIRVFKFS